MKPRYALLGLLCILLASPAFGAVYTASDSPGPGEFATIQDAKSVVRSVIQKMPDHLSRALKLYYLEDKSYIDICKIEKISIPTLKMRLFRAKRLFKRMSVEL